MAMTKEERAAYKRAWRETNKERIKAERKAQYEANKEHILAQQKAYNEANKEKISASNKRYREANKERISMQRKAYREANKELISMQRKAYREANKEKIAMSKKAWYNRFYPNNKHVYRKRWSDYNARKKEAIPLGLDTCPAEKKRLVQIYKLCDILSEATGIQHHVDHMWPLSDGGPHWSGNLQVIPAEENLSKSASVCEDTKATIIKSLYTFESERSI